MELNKKERFILDNNNTTYPAAEEANISMRGYNAIMVKGKTQNAKITMKLISSIVTTKELEAINGTDKINDTYPFPFGNNSGEIVFEATSASGNNGSFSADLEYELCNLPSDEYIRLLGKKYTIEPRGDADIFEEKK